MLSASSSNKHINSIASVTQQGLSSRSPRKRMSEVHVRDDGGSKNAKMWRVKITTHRKLKEVDITTVLWLSYTF